MAPKVGAFYQTALLPRCLLHGCEHNVKGTNGTLETLAQPNKESGLHWERESAVGETREHLVDVHGGGDNVTVGEGNHRIRGSRGGREYLGLRLVRRYAAGYGLMEDLSERLHLSTTLRGNPDDKPTRMLGNLNSHEPRSAVRAKVRLQGRR